MIWKCLKTEKKFKEKKTLLVKRKFRQKKLYKEDIHMYKALKKPLKDS